MNNKVNLNKLRDEIDTRKKEKNMVSSKLGENFNGSAPRDGFLNGLVESLKTGRETPSTALVKTVENKVSEKKGETAKFAVNDEHILNEQPRRMPISNNTHDMSQDRDELLYQRFEQGTKKTLAESISDFTGNHGNGTHTNGQPMYYPNGQPVQYPHGMPMNLNENVLGESVRNHVNKYLIENFGPVLDEAINSTIIEMFAIERIKTVLNENKDLIRSVVIDTIREIQTKNKQKGQK